jgi:predicted RNA-binding protein with PUA-like domain
MSSYWLMKTEPETYSFSQLQKDGKTNWSGVRNFQARSHLNKIARGDLVLIYHSGDDKAVVGVARVTREAYPDPDPRKPGDWVQVDIEPVEAVKQPVTLKEIKASPKFKDLILVRQSRLSVMPISAAHYQALLKMGNAK